MSKFQKSLLVGIGALVLSTVVIQASDLVRGIEGNLTGLVVESTTVCEPGSTLVLLGSHSLCVDLFEASASIECPHHSPASSVETQNNANVRECVTQSKAEAMPWRFVSLTQAQQLCARTGKRLPTNEEWYHIVMGQTDTTACVIDLQGMQPEPTGISGCTSPAGVHDLVGNVWEWVDEEIIDGNYNGRMLPESGYVALVDSNGVVAETSMEKVEEFGGDYAWTNSSGLRGMIRGGYYGSGTDAGSYAQNLSVPLDLKATGVGFRCVKDV